MEIVQSKIVRFVNNIDYFIFMGSSNLKSVSTYSFSFPSNEFSIHGIYPDERKQLLNRLRRIILREGRIAFFDSLILYLSFVLSYY